MEYDFEVSVYQGLGWREVKTFLIMDAKDEKGSPLEIKKYAYPSM